MYLKQAHSERQRRPRPQRDHVAQTLASTALSQKVSFAAFSPARLNIILSGIVANEHCIVQSGLNTHTPL